MMTGFSPRRTRDVRFSPPSKASKGDRSSSATPEEVYISTLNGESEDYDISEPLTSMSLDELRTLCYPLDFSLRGFAHRLPPSATIHLEDLHRVSVETNKVAMKLSVSRTDRNLQRYSLDQNFSVANGDVTTITASSNTATTTVAAAEAGLTTTSTTTSSASTTKSAVAACARLTTGAVPILKDGRIMLVSSSANSCWVLPKGGWETDESLAVGAIRETFEEAGVVGILGPPLPAVTYETRKARKRRLATNTSTRTTDGGSIIHQQPSVIFPQPDSPTENTSLICCGEEDTNFVLHRDVSVVTGNGSTSTGTEDGGSVTSPTSDEGTVQGVRKAKHAAEHTHNCMTIFPLYVQEVSDTWPEQQRHRRAFPLEEAILLVAERPEYVTVLQMVQEQRLHQLCLANF